MRIFFLFIFIFITQSLFSQIEILKNGFNSLGEIDVAFSKIINTKPVGQKKMESISYSDVQGSPFWNREWNAAIFVLTNGSMAKSLKAKLDLFVNEVLFVNSSNTEMSCENTQIKKIYFFKGTDTTTVMAVFESLLDVASHNNFYYKVLNEGKIRLLELKRVLVKENEYNPLVGKKEYSFYSKINYAIADNEKVIPIKSLNQSNIFSAIPQLEEYKEWLKQNNIKLKNELDITTFFSYLNSKEKK